MTRGKAVYITTGAPLPKVLYIQPLRYRAARRDEVGRRAPQMYAGVWRKKINPVLFVIPLR